MLSINHNALHVAFPDLGAQASMTIDLQRTLRLPDDNQTYPLPPGLGRFPLMHVDDLGEKAPAGWHERGGVVFPMWQSEALWLNFHTNGHPFAIKIAAGKVNAVDGKPWSNELHRHSDARLEDVPQDYVVVPQQRWLDGFNVGHGKIRQFVAMPLGAGYTAEEQITGQAEYGGIQIIVYPMKKEAYDAWAAEQQQSRNILRSVRTKGLVAAAASESMGLGAGGLMTQSIHRDTFDEDMWDTTRSVRCFVHIANSAHYLELTGQQPPTQPMTAQDYARHGLPWFSLYEDGPMLPGSSTLANVDSIATVATKKNEALAHNTPVLTLKTVPIASKTVRNGNW